jgi:hypothetical protein
MIVECVNWYLIKGLKIMTNKRNSVCIALEAILLLLYAWNSCPIPGTDISRSFVSVGCEFAFPPINSTNKHWELMSSPTSVESYSRDLVIRLSTLREVAKLLFQEHRAYHHELINSRRPDPCIYSVGNIVFARRALNLMLWKATLISWLTYSLDLITAILKGTLYKLEHCSTSHRKERNMHPIYSHTH